ncbi:hypothetical protein T11_6290 [Trichinella zimbabwensis]|uniref:Uncharacterized protein n=1 Tax=Trichinella zimbabwensis TaxID=268475 RepID=A0A0V1I8D8_9BILA|nr:hypothetical protein T11_6290 [Trichinella zimbabwensis]
MRPPKRSALWSAEQQLADFVADASVVPLGAGLNRTILIGPHIKTRAHREDLRSPTTPFCELTFSQCPLGQQALLKANLISRYNFPVIVTLVSAAIAFHLHVIPLQRFLMRCVNQDLFSYQIIFIMARSLKKNSTAITTLRILKLVDCILICAATQIHHLSCGTEDSVQILFQLLGISDFVNPYFDTSNTSCTSSQADVHNHACKHQRNNEPLGCYTDKRRLYPLRIFASTEVQMGSASCDSGNITRLPLPLREQRRRVQRVTWSSLPFIAQQLSSLRFMFTQEMIVNSGGEIFNFLHHRLSIRGLFSVTQAVHASSLCYDILSLIPTTEHVMQYTVKVAILRCREILENGPGSYFEVHSRRRVALLNQTSSTVISAVSNKRCAVSSDVKLLRFNE